MHRCKLGQPQSTPWFHPYICLSVLPCLPCCFASLSAPASEPQLLDLDGPALADAAWALARLGADVAEPWLAALVAAVDRRLEDDRQPQDSSAGGPSTQQQQQQQPSSQQRTATYFSFSSSALVERAGSQARGYAVAAAVDAPTTAQGAHQAVATVPEQHRLLSKRHMDARSLAVLIWSLARLGHRPPRGWLMAFKATSGAELGELPARQLARFIAVALLQHQRPQETAGLPGGA